MVTAVFQLNEQADKTIIRLWVKQVAKGGCGVVGLWDKLNSNREKEDIIDKT